MRVHVKGLYMLECLYKLFSSEQNSVKNGTILEDFGGLFFVFHFRPAPLDDFGIKIAAFGRFFKVTRVFTHFFSGVADP